MATWINGQPVAVVAGMTRSRWGRLPAIGFITGMGVKVDDERKFVHLINRFGEPVGNQIKYFDEADKEAVIEECRLFSANSFLTKQI